MIPFTRKPAIVDLELPKKLRAEWPGILRWMIDGCLEWKTNGLRPSESVCAATSAYFEAQDRFSQWLDDCCVRGTNRSATQEVLYASWKAWAEGNGSRAGGTAAFKTSLTDALARDERGPTAGADVASATDAASPTTSVRAASRIERTTPQARFGFLRRARAPARSAP